jgi:hypothetical protein
VALLDDNNTENSGDAAVSGIRGMQRRSLSSDDTAEIIDEEALVLESLSPAPALSSLSTDSKSKEKQLTTSAIAGMPPLS